MSVISGRLDPLQFAYQAGKSVDDAKIFSLGHICKHLKRPGSHVGLLFADFSSATIQYILTERHASHFRLLRHILLLLLNFLTDRVPCVFVNGHLSQAITSNTGSSQGCVLSPLFFIMYCTATAPW